MKNGILLPLLFSSLSLLSFSSFALNPGNGSNGDVELGETVDGAPVTSANRISPPRSWVGGAPPAVRAITSGTSQTYYTPYAFQVSGTATASQGDTYSNNSVTFTVNQTVSGASTIVLYGNGSPTSSGTLTRVTGSGDSSITFTMVKFPQYLRVRMVGGGGGASGSGTGGGAGSAGGNTTFGTSLLTANGGSGGTYNSSPASGGSASIGSGASGTALVGASGNGSGNPDTLLQYVAGGAGASSPFGGAGGGGGAGQAGTAAAANTGSGGGGSGTNPNTSTGTLGGNSGAAGGFIDAVIPSPASSYSYSVGTGGSGGSTSTSGFAGGAGGSGYIEVTAHYD